VRIVVHGPSLAAHPRLTLAARGLALRGHAVAWLERAGGGARARAEVAIGGGERPAWAALAGWLAGARALVLGLDGSVGRHWSPWQRWCWESLEAAGITEPAVLERLRAEAHDELHRLVAWPEEPAPEAPDVAHPDVDALERLCERTQARRRTRSARRAVFLDRDGTLIAERHYVSRIEDVQLLPGVAEALRLLAASDHALVVVSNQAGVGRGYYPLEAAHATMAELRRRLRREGVELDAIYFCPHPPDAGCECRKPGTLMIREAAANLHLTLRESAIVGDKLTDLAAGWAARTRTVLVRTGYGREEEARLPSEPPPDLVADDLLAAARWLAARPSERSD
jgi:D-glycero-D-manno-heptose 1,7-bisphosphate phosphatase